MSLLSLNNKKESKMNEENRQSIWIRSDIHKRLKLYAVEKDMSMIDLVDKMAVDFLDLVDKKGYKSNKNTPPAV